MDNKKKSLFFISSFVILIIFTFCCVYRIHGVPSIYYFFILFFLVFVYSQFFYSYIGFTISKRIFYYRFNILSFHYGLLMGSGMLIANLTMSADYHSFYSGINQFFIWIILGMSVFRYSLIKGYKKTVEKTGYEMLSVENERMSDSAFTKVSGNIVNGRLILTDQRLVFIPINAMIPLYDFNLKEGKPEFELNKRWGIPKGLIINNYIKIEITFCSIWLKEIGNVIANQPSEFRDNNTKFKYSGEELNSFYKPWIIAIVGIALVLGVGYVFKKAMHPVKIYGKINHEIHYKRFNISEEELDKITGKLKESGFLKDELGEKSIKIEKAGNNYEITFDAAYGKNNYDITVFLYPGTWSENKRDNYYRNVRNYLQQSFPQNKIVFILIVKEQNEVIMRRFE